MSRRIAILLAALAVAACASGSKSKTGLQEIEVEEIDPVQIVEQEVPIGMFLADLDRTLRAWTNLTHTADSPEERRRARQLEMVLRHGAAKRAGELIAQLETGPSHNRVRAASALGFSGSPEALSPLLAALSDPDVDVVHNALLGLALLALPETPTDEVCRLLATSSDSHTRANAAYALRSVVEAGGGETPRALNAARLALVDPEPMVRVQAALVLGLRADADSIKPLADAMYDEVPLVGRAAIEALVLVAKGDEGQRGPAARALVHALERGDARTKTDARRALIEIAGRDLGREPADWNAWAQRLP